MAGLSAYSQAALLNWITGNTFTRPTAWGIGLSLGTPTSTSGSEASFSGYARQTAAFGTAVSSATPFCVLSPLVNFPNSTSPAVIQGWNIWDTVLSSNSGNLLAFGVIPRVSVTSTGASAASIGSAALRLSCV